MKVEEDSQVKKAVFHVVKIMESPKMVVKTLVVRKSK